MIMIAVGYFVSHHFIHPPLYGGLLYRPYARESSIACRR